MNHITNDLGETCFAIGVPGSLERCKVQYPALIAYFKKRTFNGNKNDFIAFCGGYAIESDMEIDNLWEIINNK